MMLIDGRLVALCEQHVKCARQQLGLSMDFFLVEATQQLYHQTGNGLAIIPLPADTFVMAFENANGDRKYGAVKLNAV
ncbi:hypothetical protein C4Q28_03260 [Pseudomonas sp. SWI6]|uniref:hypothetical protein n=1 Tax=Pseudomonas sp. SWI6 TaxID=2083051 RepID=UPI000CE5D82E|nr:hypothetical protein [Pseudomonas sp. SWI6]AVD81248.1 hypothetical protein C4Q28_03260 [Pseudomonas sp. SWI6]